MDNQILQEIKSVLGGSFAQTAAQKLGESTEGISKAVSAIVPTILGGIGHKMDNDASFITTVASEAKNNFTNKTVNNLEDLLVRDKDSDAEGTQTGSFLYDVFGGGLHGIVEKIASLSGIKTSSVHQLMDASGAATLGTLGGYFAQSGILPIDFFRNNKAVFLSAIPASLGFSALFSGAHNPAHLTEEIHTHIHQAAAAESEGSSRFMNPLLWTIVGLAILILLFRGCWGNEKIHDHVVGSHEDTTAAVPSLTDEVSAPPASGTVDSLGNYIYNTGNLTKIILPGGVTIDSIGENSTENKLFHFLNDSSARVDTVDKTQGWISFDRLYFKTGSSELTTNSRSQLSNISKILAAFPNATVKLGGYTDSTGDAAKNLALSGQRANVARVQLIADGVAANRVAAEGYGKAHPVASNETIEGRAQNRRIDVRVTKK